MSELETNNTNTNEETQGQEVTGTENEEKLSYTRAELDALLQKESDRRVTQALKKQEGKLKESQRLAAMSAEEKYEYELTQRERAIEEKERQLTLAENKNTASAILADKGLSLSLVDFVLAEDADTMNSNIKRLEKAFKDCVKQEVEKRLGSKTPVQSKDPSTMSKEEFRKLSLTEKQRIFETDRNLYNELSK